MNARLVAALREVGRHPKNGHYFWREKSMHALQSMGLVDSYKVTGWAGDAFRITPAGREKLAEMEKMK